MRSKVLLLISVVLFEGCLKAPMMPPAANAPQVSPMYSLVGSQVVRVTGASGLSGGTGAHVIMPSGKVLILTNAHVCEHTQVGGYVWVARDGQRPVKRWVIAIAPKADLCLVMPLPGFRGLPVATRELVKGEKLWVLGHPHLLPLTESTGDFQGEQQADVDQGPVNSEEDRVKCESKLNQHVETVGILFGETQVCIARYTADATSVIIFPGNSGSPLVNAGGELEGVIFAGDSTTNWGDAMRLRDVRAFIKHR